MLHVLSTVPFEESEGFNNEAIVLRENEFRDILSDQLPESSYCFSHECIGKITFAVRTVQEIAELYDIPQVNETFLNSIVLS